MATIIGHSHRPLAAPPLIKLNIHHLVKKIKGFPLKAKSFRNTEHIKNPRERFHQPLPWYHGWYMNVRVLPWVKLENTVKEPWLILRLLKRPF